MKKKPEKTFAQLGYPGRLVAVEGIDGSGKSTQIYLLKRWLELQGLKVFFSEWNSSGLVKSATRRGKQQKLLTPTTFSLIHATDFADRYERQLVPLPDPLVEGGVRIEGDLGSEQLGLAEREGYGRAPSAPGVVGGREVQGEEALRRPVRDRQQHRALPREDQAGERLGEPDPRAARPR